jgi:uncharacterized repeat protein (TIGR03847 family)
MLIELDPVDRITADAVGAAGSRTFYLQARKDDRLVTLLVEKQQVQLLAASVVEILSRVGKETGQGPREEHMGLDQPLDPEWRAGRLSIGYHEERDLLVLEAEELLPEQEAEEAGEDTPEQAAPRGGLEAFGPELEVAATEEAEEGEEAVEDEPLEEFRGLEAAEAEESDLGRVRFWATREQMLSLARHGALVCAAGRPRCPLCGNPIDPEGHRCPALDGHRGKAEQ